MLKEYPEHEKAKNIKLISAQEIGEFLQICINDGILAIPLKAERRGWNIQKIINRYFKIDYQKLMDEKEQILKELNK